MKKDKATATIENADKSKKVVLTLEEVAGGSKVTVHWGDGGSLEHKEGGLYIALLQLLINALK